MPTTAFRYDVAGNLMRGPRELANVPGQPDFTAANWERLYNNYNQWIGYHDTTGLQPDVTAALFDYDASGNPILYGGKSLSFDAADRLTDFAGQAQFGYDMDGLRIEKTVGGACTYAVYDGIRLLAEFTSDGTANTLTATYTWGPTGLLERTTYSGQGQHSVYYQYDEHGNVAQRLDDDGNVLSTDVYDPWGNLLSGGDPTDPVGYGGQWGYYTDHETGLLLCTLRYYDPAAGRWLTRDPIGYQGGLNLYAYCGNDPVDALDPSGLLSDYIYALANSHDQNQKMTMGSGTFSEIQPTIQQSAEVTEEGAKLYLKCNPVENMREALQGTDIDNSELSLEDRVLAGVFAFADVAGPLGEAEAALKDTASAASFGKGATVGGRNVVYRALNAKDVEQLSKGLGLEAKNANGSWNVLQHVLFGSREESWLLDPWIATSRKLSTAIYFNEAGRGIVEIDLDIVQANRILIVDVAMNGIYRLAKARRFARQSEVVIRGYVPINAIRRIL